MIQLPNPSQDLSEAGIRANVEYLITMQTNRLLANMADQPDIDRQLEMLRQLSQEPIIVVR